MFNKIREKARETGEFVKQHPTMTACVITGVTTAFVMNRIDMNLLEQFAYDRGVEHGIVDIHLAILGDFVDSKPELHDEFRAFARQWTAELAESAA